MVFRNISELFSINNTQERRSHLHHGAGLKWSWSPGPGVDRPEPEFDHSPLSSTEVKNDWSYTSTFSMCIQSAERYNLTFIFTYEAYSENKHRLRI